MRQAGLTLVELVISIVIIGIAATALLQSLGFLTIGNADPMLRSQSNLLAQNILNEVLSQSFFEPDNDPRTDPAVTPRVCPAAESDAGYDRRLWDNVCDYRGFDSNNDDGNSGVRDKQGNLIDGLSGYRVTLAVNSQNGLSLGAPSGDVTNEAGCAAPRVLEIVVTVADPRGQNLVLSGYRTGYWNDTSC